MLKFLACMTLTCSMLFQASDLFAEEKSALKQLPAKTPVVVHLHGIEQTKSKIRDLVFRAMPTVPALQTLQGMEETLNDLLMGRDLSQVPPDAHILLFLSEIPDLPLVGLPKVGLLVPVDDYDQFLNDILTAQERRNLKIRGGIQSTTIGVLPLHFVELDGAALIATDRKVITEIQSVEQGLDTVLSEADTRMLLESDLSIYVNLKTIFAEKGELLLSFRDQVKFAMLDDARKRGINEDVVKMVNEMVALLVQGLRDSESLFIAAQLQEDGIWLTGEWKFTENSETAKYFAKEKMTPLKELEQLPASCATFAVWHISENPQLEQVLKMFQGQLGGSEELFKEAVELEAQAKPLITLGAYHERASTHGIKVIICEEPDLYAESQLKTYQAFNEGTFGLVKAMLAKPAELTPNDMTYKGFKLHRLHCVWNLEQMAKLSRTNIETVKIQMGGAEQTTWLGSNGKVYIEVNAETPEEARSLIDEHFENEYRLGEVEGFQETRKRFPEKLSFLTIERGDEYARVMVEGFMLGSGLLRAPKVEVPKKGQEYYYGWSLEMSSGRIGSQMWLPVNIWRDYFRATLQ